MKSCCASAPDDVLAHLHEKRAEFVAFVNGRVRDPSTAEDIVQSSFVKAALCLDQLQAAQSANAWFFRMLRNAIVDHARRSGASQRAMQGFGAEQEEAVAPIERARRPCQCVSKALAALKPEYEEAVRRIDVDEVTVKDFAAEKSIASGNAAVRVFRAREALKKQVESMCGECAEGGGCFDCTCGT